MTIEKKVKISLTNGKEVFLADLTSEQLAIIKMTEKEGKPNLTMKTEVVREDKDFEYERRLFKWATMPKLAMYELKVPKTMTAFKAVASEKDILDYAKGNYAIETDKVHCGIVSVGKPIDEKAVDLARKAGLPESVIEEMRLAFKKAGFGK